MTKEELEKEVSQYASEWGNKEDGTYACGRDGYLAGAEPREKRIDELKDKIAELKKFNGELAGQKASLERWFGEAKSIIKNIIRVTWSEGWNYALDWRIRAEQFLKEVDE